MATPAPSISLELSVHESSLDDSTESDELEFADAQEDFRNEAPLPDESADSPRLPPDSALSSLVERSRDFC